MSRRRRRFRRRVSLLVAVTTALVLIAALFMGGGASWPGEQLLALGGLLLILLALVRMSLNQVRPERVHFFWLLPLGLVALPLFQLIPLPEWLWSHLPGRSSLLHDLNLAGAEKTGWAPLSLVPLETERLLYTALVPVGVFMAAVTMRGGQRRKLVGICLAFAVCSIFLGFFQSLQIADQATYFYEITNPGAAVGFFANRNHQASLMLVCIALTGGLLGDRVRHHRRSASDLWVWLGAALIVIFAVGATASGSRTGLLLLVPALAGAAIAFRSTAWGTVQKKVGGLLALSVAIAFALILQSTLYFLVERLFVEQLDEFRADMWSRTLAVSAPHWGTGYGMGSFTQAYDDIGEVAADYEVYVNHAHSDYLELWAEGGLLASLFIFGALLLLSRAIRLNLKQTAEKGINESHHRGLQIGAGFGLLLLAIHSLVDYPLRTLTMATYAALLAAILVGTVRVTGSGFRS